MQSGLLFSLPLQVIALATGQGQGMRLPGVTEEMKSTSVYQLTQMDG